MSPRTVGLFILIPAALSSQEPTGVIRGAVVDQLKSVPLHTANVELRGEGIHRIVQATSAGYRFTGLPAGTYDLTIGGSFLVPMTIRPVRLKSGETRVLPPVQASYDIVACRRFPLFYRPLDGADTGKGALGGKIVDEHGRPLSGARVRIGSLGAAETDEEGRFSVADVPAGDRYRIDVAHDRYYTEDFTDFRVQAGYEAVYTPEYLNACEKDPCDPALRPVRPAPPCA